MEEEGGVVCVCVCVCVYLPGRTQSTPTLDTPRFPHTAAAAAADGTGLRFSRHADPECNQDVLVLRPPAKQQAAGEKFPVLLVPHGGCVDDLVTCVLLGLKQRRRRRRGFR